MSQILSTVQMRQIRADRKAGCHGQCPKYKEYRIYMDEQARLRKIAMSASPANYGVSNKRIGNKKVKTGKIG